MSDNFDPRFQQPRLTSEEVRQALAALAKRTGAFHADRTEWMIDDIIEMHWSNMGGGPTLTAWRNHDRLLSAEEKRVLGISPNFKVCERIVETLTPVGLQNPPATLSAMLMEPVFVRSLNKARREAVELGRNVRFSSVDDSRTCVEARSQHGRMFRPDRIPQIPFEGCQALSCRCYLMTCHPRFEHRDIESGRAWWAADDEPSQLNDAPNTLHRAIRAIGAFLTGKK